MKEYVFEWSMNQEIKVENCMKKQMDKDGEQEIWKRFN